MDLKKNWLALYELHLNISKFIDYLGFEFGDTVAHSSDSSKLCNYSTK